MDIDTRRKLGLRIKEYRKEKKLTQQQLADLIYKTESSIRKYEKGLVEIPTGVLLQIADALNVEPLVLLDDEDFFTKQKISRFKDYNNSFKKILEQLSIDETIGLLSALDKTIDYITRMSDSNDRSKALSRLDIFISSYGEMIMNSFSLSFGAHNENDCLKLLRNYNKCIELTKDHKDDLISSILSMQKGDTELRKLLLGEDK